MCAHARVWKPGERKEGPEKSAGQPNEEAGGSRWAEGWWERSTERRPAGERGGKGGGPGRTSLVLGEVEDLELGVDAVEAPRELLRAREGASRSGPALWRRSAVPRKGLAPGPARCTALGCWQAPTGPPRILCAGYRASDMPRRERPTSSPAPPRACSASCDQVPGLATIETCCTFQPSSASVSAACWLTLSVTSTTKSLGGESGEGGRV